MQQLTTKANAITYMGVYFEFLYSSKKLKGTKSNILPNRLYNKTDWSTKDFSINCLNVKWVVENGINAKCKSLEDSVRILLVPFTKTM